MTFDPRAVRAITFDAAHTLLHPNPSVGAIYQEVLARHGVGCDDQQLEASFRRAFASVAKDLTIRDGEARERCYWREVVAQSIAELSPPPADFEGLFADLWETFARGARWRVDPAAPGALATLRSQGYRLALLTNWDQRVRRVVAESPLNGLLDTLLISSEIGSEKPDPAIFRHAERVLGFPPNALLHVGDSPRHDVAGAMAAGWQAAHFAEAGETGAGGDCPRIGSWGELLDLLSDGESPH